MSLSRREREGLARLGGYAQVGTSLIFARKALKRNDLPLLLFTISTAITGIATIQRNS